MILRHSVMVGMLGRIFDRFHEYQPAKDFRERLELARHVRGADGIEVVYPSDFTDMGENVAMIKDSGFEVSAVNLNVKADKYPLIWVRQNYFQPVPFKGLFVPRPEMVWITKLI